MTAAKRAPKKRLATWMRKRSPSWAYETPRDGLRRRLYSLALENHPWWDWGHRLMILTGTDHGGNWSEPEPETWWYRRHPAKPMWRTNYPRSRFEVVTDYAEFRRRTDGLNDDEMYEWKAIGVNQDSALHLGHRFWGKAFYDLPADEWRLLRRWLRMAHRHDWWGLRSWLYSQGLHAAVYRKKPFSCGRQPPKGQGGYSHWRCQLRRGHDGFHRHEYVVDYGTNLEGWLWGDDVTYELVSWAGPDDPRLCSSCGCTPHPGAPCPSCEHPLCREAT